MKLQVLLSTTRRLAGDASPPWLKMATIAAPALADDSPSGDEPPSPPQPNIEIEVKQKSKAGIMKRLITNPSGVTANIDIFINQDLLSLTHKYRLLTDRYP